MPPRKEPKESVVYPSSKRKTPAFKPLRPSKVPRIPTTESESSVKSKPKSAPKKAPAKKTTQPIAVSDSEEDADGFGELTNDRGTGGDPIEDDESDTTLEDDPLAAARKSKPTKATSALPPHRKTSTREPSPMSVPPEADKPPDDNAAPIPSQSDGTFLIPQPLLVRLLHEAFTDKSTKIDTHAIQVFQKYVEIFVREAIARTEAQKQDAGERGECSEMDSRWLDVEDLEKVAAGLLLDF